MSRMNAFKINLVFLFYLFFFQKIMHQTWSNYVFWYFYTVVSKLVECRILFTHIVQDKVQILRIRLYIVCSMWLDETIVRVSPSRHDSVVIRKMHDKYEISPCHRSCSPGHAGPSGTLLPSHTNIHTHIHTYIDLYACSHSYIVLKCQKQLTYRWTNVIRNKVLY